MARQPPGTSPAAQPQPQPQGGSGPLPPVDYPMLCIRQAGAKGRGVAALRRFRRGETLERAPVLLIPDPQWELLNRTPIEHYYYTWTEDADAVVFGFGSFYNHAPDPNAEARRRFEEQTMEFVALRDIEAGEEICIDYGCRLWFEPQP